MIKIVSIEQMQQIEAAADAQGTSYDTMFERVSVAVAGHIQQHLTETTEPRVAILVGSGNNGGDGLVTAQRLAETTDIEVGVYLVTNRDEDEQLAAVREADVFIAKAEDDQQYRVLRNLVASAHVVVDAIFGIGVRLPLEGEITKILQNVHQALDASPVPEATLIQPHMPKEHAPQQQRVIALDCPSGVNCDTGEVDKHTLFADETITFIAVKQGLLSPPAADAVGTLLVAPLGIPADLDELAAVDLTYIDSEAAAQLLPERGHMSHKGTFGKAMIAAGSINYTGAAGLAARAAYRAGTGLVTVAAPSPVIGGLAAQMLEATWVLLPHDMGVLSEKAADLLLKELAGYSALLVGPGIGTEDTTRDMLVKLFEASQPEKDRKDRRTLGFAGLRAKDETQTTEKDDSPTPLPPLVLDADALNLLVDIEEWHQQLPEQTILTPHPGEMARLCDADTEAIQSRRVEVAREQAAAWNAIVVLKGAHTVIAAADGRTAVLPFKTAALATAGTGDVLSGVIVSLRAQGLAAYEAAVLGGYLHGLAGVLAGQQHGNVTSPVASDVLDQLSAAISSLA